MRRKRSMIFKEFYPEGKGIFEVKERSYYIPDGIIKVRVDPVLDWKKMSPVKGKRKDDPNWVVPCTHLDGYGLRVNHNWKCHYPTVVFISTVESTIYLSHRIIPSRESKSTYPTYAHKCEMRLYELDDNLYESFKTKVWEAFRSRINCCGPSDFSIYDKEFLQRVMVKFVLEECEVVGEFDKDKYINIMDKFVEYFKKCLYSRDCKNKKEPISLPDGTYIEWGDMLEEHTSKVPDILVLKVDGIDSIGNNIDKYDYISVTYNTNIVLFKQVKEAFKTRAENPEVNLVVYYIEDGKLIKSSIFSEKTFTVKYTFHKSGDVKLEFRMTGKLTDLYKKVAEQRRGRIGGILNVKSK